MLQLALVGNLARDLVDGRPPRIGGGAYHGARAFRALGTPATVVARCGPEERPDYARLLTSLGVPVVLLPGETTAAFSFHYDGAVRVMTVEQRGDAWTPADAGSLPPGGWVHVAPLLRSDFPAETLAALARGRRLSLDGQGLVRVPERGPLRLDAAFDPAMLEHVQILKLAEEEAEVIGAVDTLGVPEVLVTYGERGSTVYAAGHKEDIEAWPMTADPTGAGDAYSAAYLAARSKGLTPVSAARSATAAVAAVLSERRL